MQHKIEQIFREVMQLDGDVELRGEMNSDELEEWDSLASMSLIMKLEKEFGIKYEFDDILQMDSLDAVIKITAGKVS